MWHRVFDVQSLYIIRIYIHTQTRIMLYCVYVLGFVVDTMLADRRTRRVWCTFNHSWTAVLCNRKSNNPPGVPNHAYNRRWWFHYRVLWVVVIALFSFFNLVLYFLFFENPLSFFYLLAPFFYRIRFYASSFDEHSSPRQSLIRNWHARSGKTDMPHGDP